MIWGDGTKEESREVDKEVTRFDILSLKRYRIFHSEGSLAKNSDAPPLPACFCSRLATLLSWACVGDID